MDIKDYIRDYASRADVYLTALFNEKQLEVAKLNPLANDMLERFRQFSKGGKKLRGSLIQLGYELSGGEKNKVLEASTCIEIIHSFLLMHDDIEDQDNLRRGSLTIHKQYESEHRKNFLFKKNAGHFGISMGINLGDLGAYLGMETLLHSKLPDKNKLAAATYLSRLLQHVAYGQSLDNLYEQSDNITQKDVLDVHLHKTAIYTISGPLKIGALLGGVKKDTLGAIDKYGDSVGIAFQLRDDELGLFSSEEELGKPIGGDIKEGKNTLLKVKALELANPKEQKFLKDAYGRVNITKKDVERVREITVDTGALAYSQELSRQLVKEGKRYIPKITKDKRYQKMLSDMADFMIERKS